MKMKKLTSLSVLLALTAGGCGALTGTSYERPDVNVPAMWTYAQEGDQAPLSWWWTKFGDENLNRLVEEVLRKNNNLAVAALKVKEARLQADLALDQYLPNVTGTATASNARSLRKNGSVTRAYGASVNASYEVDLWGKLASQKDSADWEAEATEQDRQTAVIALIGTTADLYWKIAYLNERIALSEASIDAAKKMLELAKVQHAAGATAAIDEAAAEQNLAAQEAAHTQYLQQKEVAMNAFDILFDGPPGTLKADAAVLPKGEMPKLNADMPATLLERRPDLRAAEHRLRESLADTDAMRASYLPTFSLTGSLGSSSVSLTKVLTDPVGTLGAGIALPFLNWFDMRNNIAVSETQYKEAVAAFRQTLYSAFADVENALSARAKDAVRGQKLKTALASAQKAEGLYGVQYKEGYIPLQTLLDAQERRRTAEAAVLENIYTQLGDSITLYKALGGDVTR